MTKKTATTPVKDQLSLLLLQKKAVFKKGFLKTWKKTKPYLALKYWPIYLFSFVLGFWLWGPFHGWHTLSDWHSHLTRQIAKPLDSETLQRQITLLRQELKDAHAGKEPISFDPNTLSRPALGEVIREFDWFESGNSWRLHSGVDIKLPADSNIIAAAAGRVLEVTEITPGNFSITIDHGDGWRSTYGNLSKIMVIEGQPVIKGVIVGVSGSFGCDPQIPSLHFAVLHNQKPVDPKKVIPGL